jgi:hypothetical protein
MQHNRLLPYSGMGSLRAPAPEDLPILFYSLRELSADPELSTKIADLINACWTKHKGFQNKPRFANTAELWEMLGEDGICAVAMSGTEMVGSASLRSWRPDGVVDEALRRERPLDAELVDQGLSYEVKAVVTLDSPISRGRGLSGFMIQALLSQVQRRHHGEEILFWLQIAEEQNGSYWRRRGGYEQVGPVEIKPQGTWGALKDFEFLTMVQRMPA